MDSLFGNTEKPLEQCYGTEMISIFVSTCLVKFVRSQFCVPKQGFDRITVLCFCGGKTSMYWKNIIFIKNDLIQFILSLRNQKIKYFKDIISKPFIFKNNKWQLFSRKKNTLTIFLPCHQSWIFICIIVNCHIHKIVDYSYRYNH